MFNWLAGAGKTIEKIATEWIDTDLEKAESKTLMIKALDPNGMMRRQISANVSRLYVIYILTAMILLFLQSFGLSATTIINGEEVMAVSLAIESLKELFIPITTCFTAIVAASFGVNTMNTVKKV